MNALEPRWRCIKYCVLLKSLQEAQEAAIAQLEKEVDLKRFKHSDAVQKLKSAFLNEKRTFQANADAKVADMQQKANEVKLCVGELPFSLSLIGTVSLLSSKQPVVYEITHKQCMRKTRNYDASYFR